MRILFIFFIHCTLLVQVTLSQTNNAPVISPEFPDEVITKQGVSHQDSIFALPLASFGQDADGDSLNWSTTTEDSVIALFSAEQETLYVHSQRDWYGRGSFVVRLEDTSGEFDELQVSVTTFKTDGTLLSEDGSKTEYYIPWNPQLDLNRIASVEEHITVHGKDEGYLDRSIHWSKWEKMEKLKDVTKSTWWSNELIDPDFWSREAQFAMVDAVLDELKDLGANAIRIENPHYVITLSGNEIFPIYERFNGAGPTMRPDELAYLVNEAHRLGMKVLASNWIGVDRQSTDGIYHEIWQANPSDINLFWTNFIKLISEQMLIYKKLGVDFGGTGNSVELVGPDNLSNRDLTIEKLNEAADAARVYYPGPLYLFGGKPLDWFPHPRRIEEVELWKKVDIIGLGVNIGFGDSLATSNDPPLQEVIDSWERRIDEYYIPFQQRFNKPFLPMDNGCYSIDGAIKWGSLFFRDLVFIDNPPVDVNDMRLYYESFSVAFKDMPGYFGPGWYRYEFMPSRISGRDFTMNPRLKVEDIIEREFKGFNSPKLITIDGDSSDWLPAYFLTNDLLGDNASGGDDIIGLWGVRNNKYLFLMTNYEKTPMGGLTYWIDINNDNNPEYFIGCNKDSEGIWKAFLTTIPNNKTAGVADILESSSSLELRLHKRYMDYFQGDIRIGVTDFNSDWTANDDEISGWFNIVDILTSVGTFAEDVPKAFKLFQSYPNPFNAETIISYQISRHSNVKLRIFNLLGQEITKLIDEIQSVGKYQVQWNAKDNNGNDVASGIYLFQLSTDRISKTRKMLIIR